MCALEGVIIICEECNGEPKAIQVNFYVNPLKSCNICGIMFSKNNDLEIHLKSHDEAERLYFDTCGNF